jgi:hypothetical protein
MNIKFLLGTFVPLFMLSACGDGWQIKAYNNTPYHDRTAGAGVEYVRAHIFKEKGPKTESIKYKEPVKNAVPEKRPLEENRNNDTRSVVDRMLNSGEKFFRDLHKK